MDAFACAGLDRRRALFVQPINEVSADPTTRPLPMAGGYAAMVASRSGLPTGAMYRLALCRNLLKEMHL